MTDAAIVRSGQTLGERPERPSERLAWHKKSDSIIKLKVKRWRYGSFRQFGRVLNKVSTIKQQLSEMSGLELEEFRIRLASQLHTRGIDEILCIEVFALVSLTTERTLGISFYDEQLYAGWLLLHGFVAEMQTGEGKTLTATLPACTAAMAGSPVHVITANDYLVSRDAALMQPVYQALSLSVGTVVSSQNEVDRRAAYRCDITYVCNKQIVFDYLRDQKSLLGAAGSLRNRLGGLVRGSEVTPLMTGLCFAIVDEADSVLIDDARTPFILSQPDNKSVPSTNSAVALGLARRLKENEDFDISQGNRTVELTEHGQARLREMTQTLTGSWSSLRYSNEVVTQALTALHLFHLDRHYLISDGKVVLIDESTGRAARDRRLSHGIHQMVEVKEGCSATGNAETVNSISSQRFFRRYYRLSGVTGTAREISNELESVFQLPVTSVPLHHPSRRAIVRIQLYATTNEKFSALIERVATEHRRGRPILIGTRSVAESEQISLLLCESGLANRVLNATQDHHEAEIVARAGEQGSIVVATNMAGRGTDIPLGPGVTEIGGLHVICTHLNDARRIDRQLSGRCARQGDPGSFETIISLEDQLYCDSYPDVVRAGLARCASSCPVLWNLCAPLIARWPQRAKERQHQLLRQAVLRNDEDLEKTLAFSGFSK